VADFQPFQGLRYRQGKIGALSSVFCSPYDLISPEEAKLYQDKSPYNAVRIELDKANHLPTAYQQAYQTLQSWLEEGILFLESQPSFYLIEYCFKYRNSLRHRWELVGRVRLSPGQSSILPHEAVLAEPVLDRLQLFRTLKLNSSPILGIIRRGLFNCLNEAKGGSLSRYISREPNLKVTDFQGVSHRIWVLSDPSINQKISGLLSDKVIYLADGHHRLEAALAYQKEQLSIHPYSNGREGFNFVLMSLIDAEDPGVVLLPLHRLVRLPQSVSPSRLWEGLNNLFYLRAVAPKGLSRREDVETWLDILAQHDVILGLYGLGEILRGVHPERDSSVASLPQNDMKRRALNGMDFVLLIPRDQALIERMMPQEYSQHWKRAATAILRQLILSPLLGIDSAEKEKGCLEYTTDAWEAIRRVDSGEFQLAFLLNPVPLSSVLAVAEVGEEMVPKSTFFYPKPPAGLVMNPLWD
jgi:uncharacterized protein (DUF1015 family)